MSVRMTATYQDLAEKHLIDFLTEQGRCPNVVVAAYKLLRYYLGNESKAPNVVSGLRDAAEQCARRAVLLAIADCCTRKQPVIRREVAARILRDWKEAEVTFRDLDGQERTLQII